VVLGNFCVGFCSFSMFFLHAEFFFNGIVLFSSPKILKDKPAGIMEQISAFCSFSNSEIFLPFYVLFLNFVFKCCKSSCNNGVENYFELESSIPECSSVIVNNFSDFSKESFLIEFTSVFC
jgi:hypothetical protein